MIKFVTSSEKLLRYAMRFNFIGRFVKGDILHLPQYKDSQVRDMVCSSIGLINGVSKQSEAGRFTDVDGETILIIKDRQCIDVHDIGVSNGITSLELFQRLNSEAINLYVSDKYSYFFSYSRFGMSFIYDPKFRLLAVHAGPFFADHRCSNLFIFSRLLFAIGNRKKVRADQCCRISLFESDVLAAIEQGKIQHIDYDVLNSSISGVFDFVRCMNLLNLAYFAPNQINQALQSIHTSLRENGVFQIGRTSSDGHNNLSFYEKNGISFHLIKLIGDGSEIDTLIQNYRS